jgi:HSP20 family protein
MSMLLRFDPFRELDRLSETLTTHTLQSAAPMDAYRHGEELHVDVDLPGVDRSSLDLTVERNVLTIKAERGWTPGAEDEVVIAERPQGTVTRRLFLGESLDTEHIRADYTDGVLRLVIPVAEQAKARKLSVTSGETGPASLDAKSVEVREPALQAG